MYESVCVYNKEKRREEKKVNNKYNNDTSDADTTMLCDDAARLNLFVSLCYDHTVAML